VEVLLAVRHQFILLPPLPPHGTCCAPGSSKGRRRNSMEHRASSFSNLYDLRSEIIRQFILMRGKNCIYELLMYVVFVVRCRTGVIIGMILLAFP